MPYELYAEGFVRPKFLNALFKISYKKNLEFPEEDDTKKIWVYRITKIKLLSKDTVNKKSLRWSNYQGKMNWYKAEEKCARIKMRLPTIVELNAILGNEEDGTITPANWKEVQNDYEYWSLVNYEDMAYGHSYFSSSNNKRKELYVRCVY
jgi:hypothetical protein